MQCMRDPRSFCGSKEHIWQPNRREFLFVGLLGSLGLTLGDIFKLRAQTLPANARAQSVINIFLPGGIAAQESFDPKLLVPIEYRGPLGTTKTRLDGIYFSEQLKRTAVHVAYADFISIQSLVLKTRENCPSR